jgi:hypothetical protein
MRYRYDSGVMTPVPNINVCRKEHVPQAGWAADDHGDVWMFRSCGVCELQASNEDHEFVKCTLMFG